MNKRDHEPNEVSHEDMTYDEFAETMRNSVAELLGESAKVMLSAISKVNRPEIKALSILSAGANTSPAVELESYYNDFLEGENIEELAERVTDFCKEKGVSGNTERAKEHIVCHLINAGMNERLLKQVPHLPYQDSAVVYYYQADKDARGGWSILVKNEQLKI